MKKLLLPLLFPVALFGAPSNPISNATLSGTLTLTPSSVVGTIHNTGNTLWVDAVNGNDSTAVRGDALHPYLTLNAAHNAASNGDTVLALPGTYTPTATTSANLFKGGLSYFFMPNTFVNFSPTTTASSALFVYDDSVSNGRNFKVDGYANFVLNPSGTFAATGCLIDMGTEGTGTKTWYWHCQSIIDNASGAAGWESTSGVRTVNLVSTTFIDDANFIVESMFKGNPRFRNNTEWNIQMGYLDFETGSQTGELKGTVLVGQAYMGGWTPTGGTAHKLSTFGHVKILTQTGGRYSVSGTLTMDVNDHTGDAWIEVPSEADIQCNERAVPQASELIKLDPTTGPPAYDRITIRGVLDASNISGPVIKVQNSCNDVWLNNVTLNATNGNNAIQVASSQTMSAVANGLVTNTGFDAGVTINGGPIIGANVAQPQSNGPTITLTNAAAINTVFAGAIGTGTAAAAAFIFKTPILGSTTGSTSQALANTFTLSNAATTLNSPFTGTGNILSSSATGGIGYTTGAGSTVSQSTDRTTAVTINAVTGTITGQATSLAGQTGVNFTVTNSSCAAGDFPVLSMVSGNKTTTIYVTTVSSGAFNIEEFNENTVTADTTVPVIRFAIIKSSNN